MRAKPWEVPDGLWERIEPLLPARQRRLRYPGRKPLDDRRVLQGILFVLHTGIGWEHLPQELGGSTTAADSSSAPIAATTSTKRSWPSPAASSAGDGWSCRRAD